MSSLDDLCAAILAVCDWYEEEYGVGFEDSTLNRSDIESADADALRKWWSHITWTVGVNREDGSPATKSEAHDALATLWPGDELEVVGDGVFNATLPPGLALDLMRDGHVEVRLGDLTITAELP